MKRKEYERQMRVLHGELVAMQEWVKETGAKICIVFEGRDTAGKGGTIKRITERVSPRVFRVVALPAPTEREKSQMYIQRYLPHFPAAGEVVIFDRSWYNRAGVEPVMGFCTPVETERFLELTPGVEKAMADDGILLLKYWLEVSPGEQTRRLKSRINDPRKIWKLSDMDLKSYRRWYDYSRARDAMFAATDTAWAPWYIAHTDSKRRGRLNIISHLLSQIPYKPLAPQDVTLPRRQPAHGYVAAGPAPALHPGTVLDSKRTGRSSKRAGRASMADRAERVPADGDPPGGAGHAPGTLARVTRGQRWLARLAFAAALAAAVVLLLAGGLKSVTALLLGFAGLAIICAAAWWFLAHRGPRRWLAGVVLVAAPVAVIVLYVAAGLLWEIALSVVLALAAVAAGRAALSGGRPPGKSREDVAVPQQQPFVIMNPRSGGGKVGIFGLEDKAAALGAEVALLEGPGVVDVAAMAREAVDAGADLLGVAGGDGTQALVAGIAAGRDIPMMVISAGTRNHFALDLGLDRDDPATGLDALTDGVELRIDLGLIGDRTFVNNASFGAYAQVVQSPAYRDDKSGTALAMLPDLLSGHQGAHLVVRVDGQVILDGPQAVLVSNNPYETGDIAGLGRRARLDQGVLGVVGVKIANAAQAAGLLRQAQRSRSVTVLTAREVIIDADQPHIPVGIDGESVLMPTPVRCTIRPLALRVRLPRDRPGVPDPRPAMDWSRLRQQALTFTRGG